MVSELFDMAEEDLGFSIDVQYGDTSNMVTKMLTEGEQSPADIIFAQSSGYLGALAKARSIGDTSRYSFEFHPRKNFEMTNKMVGNQWSFACVGL